MKWIQSYHLFLFDFDGILANTEELHYKAYIKMCAERGFSLKWDQTTYIHHAQLHYDLEEAIYKEFPKLKEAEPNWNILYKEKTAAYLEFLKKDVGLMPHIEILLEELEKKDIKRCVVTHSGKEAIDLIRKKHPILDTIPFWITREQYKDPKPSPECYQKAIDTFSKPKDRIIGFEDSPRGLKALLGTKADAVMITPHFQKKEIMAEVKKEFGLYPSFKEFFLIKDPH